MNVAVIGASDNPERMSNLAVRMLKEKGHRVFPVNPRLEEVEGIKAYRSVRDVPEALHTVTVYVSKDISSEIMPDILAKSPKRIIFNPGAENAQAEAAAASRGIQTLEACTVTMLKTNQF